MSDQTLDPTTWSDDQLDNLLDALAERAAERDDLDLPGGGPSRRTVLASLLGAGGLGLGATQLGAAASWGSASGTVGTQSSPIDTANIRDLDAKALEAEQVDIATETLASSGDRLGRAVIAAQAGSDNTSSTNFQESILEGIMQWDQITPAGVPTRVGLGFNSGGSVSNAEVRLRNKTDGETVIEATDIDGDAQVVTAAYTPTTTGAPINLELQIRNTAGNSWDIFTPTVTFATDF